MNKNYATNAKRKAGSKQEQTLGRNAFPQNVGINGLASYLEEKAPLMDNIQKLIDQIANDNVKPECNYGWGLTEKVFYGHYNPNKDGLDEEQHARFIYALNQDGRFIKHSIWETEYWRKGCPPWAKREERSEEVKIEEIITELDFDGYGEYHVGKSWDEHSWSIETLAWWARFKASNSSCEFKRLYSKKGQGLYNRLKEIISKHVQRLQAQKEYEEELSVLVNGVKKEYEIKFNELYNERDTMMEKAKVVAVQRSELVNSVYTMKDELKSLLFFQRRKRKELMERITIIEDEIRQLPDIEEVSRDYKNKENALQFKKANDIKEQSKQLLNKYPLLKE